MRSLSAHDGRGGGVLTHEVDVAVVHAGPEDDWTHSASLVAGIECKQYATPVPINVVRTVIGTDLVLWRGARGSKVHGRRNPVHRLWGICTTGGGGSHAQQLSEGYDITWIPVLARQDGIVNEKIETFAELLQRRLQW